MAFLKWKEETDHDYRGRQSLIDQVTVGRNPKSKVTLQDEEASWSHAVFEFKNSEGFVTDLGSTNGTWLNGSRLEAHLPTRLSESDVVTIGETNFQVEVDSAKGSDSLGVGGGGKSTLTIGRSSSCDLCLNEPSVSRQHARLEQIDSNSWRLSDLGSSNGTFVNGVRITSSIVGQSDRIRIGNRELHLDRSHLSVNDDFGGTKLEVSHLAHSIRVQGEERRLLDSISFTVLPGQMVGILGSSGAGKSTLLLALTGYQPADMGNVYINGIDFYAHQEEFISTIGYVPQSDILHGELTLEKALTFSARLRLPDDTTDAEVAEIVRRVIGDLELHGKEHTRIADLSGGERKRANIGVEILTKPGLLFLDEPMTGLDVGLERKIFDLLRKFSRQGQTIVMVTHSLDTISKFDRLLVMGNGGRLTFYGTPSDALQFLGASEYGDIYSRISDTGAHHVTRFASARNSHLTGVGKSVPQVRMHRNASTMVQAKTLLARNMEIVVGDRKNLLIWLLQAPVMVALICAIYGPGIFEKNQAMDSSGHLPIEDGPILIFLMGISLLCFALFNSSKEIVKERRIYERERHVGLGLAPYLASKILLLGSFAFVQCLILFAVLSLRIHFDVSPVAFLGILSLGAFNAVLLGLLISSVVSTPDQATTSSALVLLGLIIFSGLVPLEKLSFLRPLAVFSAMRWTYGGLSKLVGIPDLFDSLNLGSRVHDVLRTEPSNAVAMLLLLAAVTLAMVFAAMSRKRAHIR